MYGEHDLSNSVTESSLGDRFIFSFSIIVLNQAGVLNRASSVQWVLAAWSAVEKNPDSISRFSCGCPGCAGGKSGEQASCGWVSPRDKFSSG